MNASFLNTTPLVHEPGEIRRGIVRDLPAEAYHCGPEVSASALASLAKSPAHCWALHMDPARPPRQETLAMRAGTMLHAFVLEPKTFWSRYVQRPAGLDGRTKEGKAWLAENATRTAITVEERDTLMRQEAAIGSVPELQHALSAGQAETSIFWNDSRTGLPCRARPDWLHMLPDGRAIVLDLKTTADASPQGFARSVWHFGYHRAQAHYTAGMEACGIEVAAFLFAVVTSSYPFIAVPYLLDDDSLRRGAEERLALMDRFALCKRENHWPAYGSGVKVLSLPSWARFNPENEE